jgi:hypothetical protein
MCRRLAATSALTGNWQVATVSTRLGLLVRYVVPAPVGRIEPHPHDCPGRGIAESLVGGYPAGRWRGRLGVAAPMPDRIRRCPARICQLEVGYRSGGFVQVLRSQDNADPAVELGVVEFAACVVLPKEGKQPLAIGLANQGPRAARHGYSAGRTTTAVPYATISVSC